MRDGGLFSGDGCVVMGILNVTPDSFSDGGADADSAAAVRRALRLHEEGARIVDVGGESTRPGHVPVPASEELRRVVPVVEGIRQTGSDICISVDTRKAEVARAALQAGADLINDVSGLDDPAMARVVAESGAGLVVMRHRPIAGDLVQGCRDQLQSIVARALDEGIRRAQIAVDPGLGFGDPPGGDPDANLTLLGSVAQWSEGLPALVGASRKRFIGALSGEPVAPQRVGGSVAAALLAADAGARAVRVHDVAATVQALRVWSVRRVAG